MQYRSDIPRDPRLIATQLAVSHLLEGSVQRSAGKVRVHVQLIDARTATQLWAEKYDRDYADVFAIQSDIAQAITNQLNARLSSREMAAIQERPTADLAAYDLYLQAKELFEVTGFNVLEPALGLAVRLLNEAVGRDRRFVLAYCLLVRAHSDLYWYNLDHTPQRLALLQEALEHAVALAPDAGEVHLARAIYLYHGLRDYQGASRELDLARLTLPNNAGVYLFRGAIARIQGRWEEAVREFDQAASLNPRGVFLIKQQWLNCQFMHRYDEEVRLLDKLFLLVPNDPDVLAGRARVSLRTNADPRRAYAVIPALLDESPENAQIVAKDALDLALMCRDPELGDKALAADPTRSVRLSNLPEIPHAFGTGLIANLRHDDAAAQEAFRQAREIQVKRVAATPDNPGLMVELALIDAMLGHRADAIAEGERAAQAPILKVDVLLTANVLYELAAVYANAGERDKALDLLARILKRPTLLHYGYLKLHPYWDPLRGDPRFEALVANMGPKTIQ